MENLSYIFRAGHRVISPILLLLALFTCNYAFSHPAISIPDSTISDIDSEAPWYYTIEASDGKGGDIDRRVMWLCGETAV